jgi:AcrR family transcriptional regulator
VTALPHDPPRRSRRSTEEVRQLLIEAAREYFQTRGYAGASVRDIAGRADVKESVLFRHFGSKARLFERAILDPVVKFLEDYTATWSAEATTSTEPSVLVETYLRGLYDVASQHRELILALISARQFEPELFGEVNQEPALASIFEQMTSLVIMHKDAHQMTLPDPLVTTRASFSLVMGMALLDEWLFPAGMTHPGRERIITELVNFQLHGVAHRS